ncbi:MAG TPA: hypothetical protein VLF68_04870 [Candidatus Saccharimonadales bacterium]|nr:hypothetical protein [Candidatus Saccharimonadales bacterium]
MPEGVTEPKKFEKPQVPASFEKIVDLKDRKFVVIGTEHGTPETTFPGEIQTNEDIAQFEARVGPMNALVIDGASDLTGHTITDGLIDGSVPLTPFRKWAYPTIMKRGIPLIGADPVYVVPFLDDPILKQEENDINKTLSQTFADVGYGKFVQASSEKAKRETQSTGSAINHEQQKEQNLDNARKMLGLAVIGTAIAYGLHKRKEVLSRRSFLKLAGGVAVSGLLEGGITLTRNQAIGKLKHLHRAYSELARFAVVDANMDINTIGWNDRTVVGNRLSAPGELTDADYNSPEFQRDNPYSDLEITPATQNLRNAIIAEVLSSPLNNIMPHDFRPPLRAPIVMGWGHLDVLPEHRISTLLQNERLRREVIEGLLTAVYTGIDDLATNNDGVPIDKKAMMNGFKSFAKTYSIDRDGKVQSKPFRVKAIDDIVDRIVKNNPH